MRTARIQGILLIIGATLAAFNSVNVLTLKLAAGPSMYIIDSLVLFMASAAVFQLQGKSLPGAVRFRMRLWASSLACYGTAFLWCALRDLYFAGGLIRVQILLYATTYALAFLAVVSPSAGQRWSRDWWLDGLQALVLAAMFFQTSLALARGLDHLLFVCVLQIFLGVAALLAGRSALTREERRFTICVGAYYFFTAVLSLVSNATDVLGIVWANVLADALYPVDSLLALILAFVLRAVPCKQRDLSPHHATAMPMLTTAAIVLLCIPTLRADRGHGVLLIGAAFLLFGMRVSIVLSRHQAEHRRLRRGTEEFRRLALTDPLTGIANRRAFMTALSRIARAAASAGPQFALILMDLDELKQINDSRGHQAGDRAIQTFAALLREAANTSFDRTARLGGDEFAVILPSHVDPATWVADFRETLEECALPFSAGVVAFSLENEPTPATLIKIADARLYEEKKKRRTKDSGTRPLRLVP